MIGQLPKFLEINGKEWAIRSDYRVALLIFQALSDAEIDDRGKSLIVLDSLYVDFESMHPDIYQDALCQAKRFLDRGDGSETGRREVKLLDWEQDEQLIFPSINKVAGAEVRELDYMHWWTFLGYFNEIGEGLFSTVVAIRNKKAKGKKLEKHEQEFYTQHRAMVDICRKLTKEEQEQIQEEKDYWNKVLG